MTKLQINLLRLDGGTQPRASIDNDVVDDYRQRMEEGDIFPPVKVFYDGEHYWLADGFHRVYGAKRVGLDVIHADVQQGTQRDAVWFSFGANKQHGLKREKGDVKRALELILADAEWCKTPQSKIAEHIGTSAGYVSDIVSIRKRIDGETRPPRKVTRNGTTYEMKTAAIGRPSPQRTTTVEELPPIEIDQAAEAFDEPTIEVDLGAANQNETSVGIDSEAESVAANPPVPAEQPIEIPSPIATAPTAAPPSRQRITVSAVTVQAAVRIASELYETSRKPFSQISTIDLRNKIEQLRDVLITIAPTN